MFEVKPWVYTNHDSIVIFSLAFRELLLPSFTSSSLFWGHARDSIEKCSIVFVFDKDSVIFPRPWRVEIDTHTHQGNGPTAKNLSIGSSRLTDDGRSLPPTKLEASTVYATFCTDTVPAKCCRRPSQTASRLHGSG
jgi:hypothetical protein